MRKDPVTILTYEEMGTLQFLAVGVCILLNALDGFDVASISFASPGITTEWGISRAALGVVLSMELFGMAAGSILIGTLADRFGRRPTILASLVMMTGGMLLAASAQNVMVLSAYRLMTGLGIGGMLACTNAMTAELANDRHRNLAVALMASGYPIGAALGGLVASFLLVVSSWRSIFLFGAGATAFLFPITVALLPESVIFLANSGKPDTIALCNRILARMGRSLADCLPAQKIRPRTSLLTLFGPELAVTTVLLTLIYFAHVITFYFILKWVPKIVVDMGFAASSAGGVLVWANVGGASGSLLLSYLTRRVDVRALVIGALLLSAIMVTMFGQVRASLPELSLVAACAGFCTNGAIVGIYSLIARFFPAEVRAGGTGIVIGIGRGGAALGPILAGVLFSAGKTLPFVSLVIAMGSLLAAIALGLLCVLRSRQEVLLSPKSVE